MDKNPQVAEAIAEMVEQRLVKEKEAQLINMKVKKVLKKISPKPPKVLTANQRTFIDEYLKTGNQTRAAMKAYGTPYSTSAKLASANVRKPAIATEIEKRLKVAKDIIYEIATDRKAKPSARLSAAQDIIDRIEGKAVARIEHGGEVKQNIVFLPAREIIIDGD